VGGKDEQLGAVQRENPGRLRHPQVEADEDADLAVPRVQDLQGAMSGTDELVQSQLRQMRFSVEAGWLARFEDGGGVVNLGSRISDRGSFRKPDDGHDVQVVARLTDHLDWLRVG